MIVCFYNYQMTEVQLLCASEKELLTHRKPSLSRNISSFTLAVLLLNLLQTLLKTHSGNEAVAIDFSFSSSPPVEETTSIFFLNTNVAIQTNASVAIFSSAILVVSFPVKFKMWNVYSTFFTREYFIFLLGQCNLPFTCRLQTLCQVSSYWMTNIWPVSVPPLIYSGVVVAFQSNACAPQAERIITNTLHDQQTFFCKKKIFLHKCQIFR